MTTTGGWLKGRMKGGGGGGGEDREVEMKKIKKKKSSLSSSVKYLVPEAVTEVLKLNQYADTRKH